VSNGAWTWFPDWWGPNYQTLLRQLGDPAFDGWLLFRYALQALLSSAPIFLADYALGLALLRRLNLNLAGGLRHATALGLGMGAAGLGLFLFGFLGHLTFRGILIFTFLQCLLGLTYAGRELRWPRWRWRYLWGLPVLLLYVPDLMMPILEYDSTMYHMAAANWYMQQGQLTYHEGIRFHAQPHLPVMLYMRHWWLTGDANVLKLVNLEYLAMLLGVFTWLARRHRIRWGALAAASLAFGSPIFGYVMRQEYADFALASWLAVGAVLLLSRGMRWQWARVLAAGLLLGFAGSSKLQGLLVAGCFVLAYLAVKRDWRATVWLGGGVAAMGLPWWIRGWLATGSPFYPFLSNSPDVKALFQVNAGYGTGRGVMDFLLLPWNMVAQSPELYADLFRFGPSLGLLLLIGGAAFARRGKLDRGTQWLLAGSLLFTLAWFRSGQVMRYEACLLPLWGALLLGALQRLRWRNGWVALALAPLLISTCLLTTNMVRYAAPPPVTWPATQRMLNAILPYYRATQAASHLVQLGDKVYTWFCDDIRLYAPGKSYGDWFGGYTYTWLGNVHEGEKLREPGPMVERLKREGFQWIIVDRKRAARGGSIYGSAFLESGIVKPFVPVPGTRSVYDDGRYVVLRVL
jgi:hypothetical protein